MHAVSAAPLAARAEVFPPSDAMAEILVCQANSCRQGGSQAVLLEIEELAKALNCSLLVSRVWKMYDSFLLFSLRLCPGCPIRMLKPFDSFWLLTWIGMVNYLFLEVDDPFCMSSCMSASIEIWLWLKYYNPGVRRFQSCLKGGSTRCV